MTLEQALDAKQAEHLTRKFASGFTLVGDFSPLLPAKLAVTGDGSTARVAVCEGRYHQVRALIISGAWGPLPPLRRMWWALLWSPATVS